MELKGGQNTVIDRVVEQIQAGVDIIDSLVTEQDVKDICPILMYKGKDPTTALQGKSVVWRGIKRSVIPRKCGESLGTIKGL